MKTPNPKAIIITLLALNLLFNFYFIYHQHRVSRHLQAIEIELHVMKQRIELTNWAPIELRKPDHRLSPPKGAKDAK